jgi:hypothetical protein
MYPVPLPAPQYILENPDTEDLVAFMVRTSGLRGQHMSRESELNTKTAQIIGIKEKAAIQRLTEVLWIRRRSIKELLQQASHIVLIESTTDGATQGYLAFQHIIDSDKPRTRIVDFGASVLNVTTINATTLALLARGLLEKALSFQKYTDEQTRPMDGGSPRKLPLIDLSLIYGKMTVAEARAMHAEIKKLVDALAVIAQAKAEYGEGFPDQQEAQRLHLQTVLSGRPGHSIVQALKEWQHLSQIFSANNDPDDYRWAKTTAMIAANILFSVLKSIQESGDLLLPANSSYDFTYDVTDGSAVGKAVSITARYWDSSAGAFSVKGLAEFTPPLKNDDVPSCTLKIDERGSGIASDLAGYLLRKIKDCHWYKKTVRDRL